MAKPQLAGMSNFNSSRTSVLSEDIKFDAGVSNLSLPLLGVDSGNLALTLKGKSRITNVAGVYVGTDAQMLALRTELETEANDNNQQEKVYTAADTGTFSVLIMNFVIRRDLTSENQATFSMDLLTTNQLL